tara:strand:- start:3992 stop:4477 length:486 start_codon:yes stop_codon:yes gene_type:complete
MSEKEINELIKLLNENCDIVPKILKCMKNNVNDVKGIIFHKGKPPGEHECSKCLKLKDNNEFKYYKKRVDKNNYLMRSNAICHNCSKINNEERKKTLFKDKNKIPPKPKAGSICESCNRKWGTKDKPRNWHRDHDAKLHKFRGWLCGDCNMAKHDHRLNIS